MYCLRTFCFSWLEEQHPTLVAPPLATDHCNRYSEEQTDEEGNRLVAAGWLADWLVGWFRTQPAKREETGVALRLLYGRSSK